MPEKPPHIAANAFKSRKWDELTAGRGFKEADVPALELLCQWHAIVERCIDDMTTADDEVHVAYSNDHDEIKALPQVGIMKQASAEIRALNKQLGIKDGNDEKQQPKETRLYVIQTNREKRAAGAALRAGA
ncbi:MAG: P27 family phage terminase small subunit [Coriobacteriaceae bacterium]|jgi:phage terminase small subunit|nr:P27 family phage terminase small subunit [Coriobacteriaceae bacterium]